MPAFSLSNQLPCHCPSSFAILSLTKGCKFFGKHGGKYEVSPKRVFERRRYETSRPGHAPLKEHHRFLFGEFGGKCSSRRKHPGGGLKRCSRLANRRSSQSPE